MRSDEELMQATAGGDMAAYEELVRRHQQLAWQVAYHLLGDPAEAEDSAQEAFLKILEAAGRYEPLALFKTYLSRVVTNLCYDRIEKKKPIHIDPADPPRIEITDDNPLENLEREEEKKLVEKALASLPVRQKTAIVLQCFEDFSYEQIATSMQISKKAVERLLARARDNLFEELNGKI